MIQVFGNLIYDMVFEICSLNLVLNFFTNYIANYIAATIFYIDALKIKKYGNEGQSFKAKVQESLYTKNIKLNVSTYINTLCFGVLRPDLVHCSIRCMKCLPNSN